jgi:uncharacterized membrane protein
MTSTQPEVAPAPRWAVVSTGILALIGLGISTYLTIAHYIGTEALACSDNGAINCAKVTTSPESVILGIPVAVLGLAFYLVAVPLYSPWSWRSRDRRVHIVRLVAICTGMIFVLWLIAAELLIIGAICLWCTGVHIVTFALFVLTIKAVTSMLDGEAEELEVDDG